VIHHIAFGYLQNSGVENVYFTQLDYFELRTFIIHFLLAAIIFFICGLWAYQLKKHNETQIKQSLEVGRLQKEALLAKEMADLQESLAHEKYLLDSLMDNMPDMIYFKNRESKLIRVSKFMAQRFNSRVDDLIGKNDFDFQDEAHARQAFEDEQHIMKTQQPRIDYIEKEIGEDGSEHWISTTKLPMLNIRGEVIGTFGMSKDITKIKTLEREQLNADMEKAVAQGKFEIASEVMHDIGNAVVGFGAYITRIRRSLDGNHPEKLENLAGFFQEQQPALCAAIGETKAGAVVSILTGITESQKTNEEEIKKSISEQQNIITHIQEILSIQRQYIEGQNRQERKTVNIRHIINDSLSMVMAIIEKSSIAVTLNVAADLPGIKGDRTRLMQLVLNVLKNSIEALDVNAADKTILINAFRYKEQLVVQVKDTGSGFNESVAKRLFERGFTTKPSGSGLGLYNCLTIIESHEGEISLTSEGEGKGALATIGFKI
jgi:PAS domain S-box-containing protein